MKKLLQNKILLILAIFVLCFSSICITNVEASSINEYSNLPSAVLDSFKETTYYNNSKYGIASFYLVYGGYYRFFIFDMSLYPDASINISGDTLTFSRDDIRWSYVNINPDGSLGYSEENIKVNGYHDTIALDNYYAYNININKDGESFFPLPPQVTTMEITQVEELPKAIIQIIQIILPVFLIVFGTLLVLYLIKSKNLLHL